jgi:hypothetical protein
MANSTIHFQSSWGWDVIVEVSNKWKLKSRAQFSFEHDDDITKGFWMSFLVEKGSKWKSVFGKGKGAEDVKLIVRKAPTGLAQPKAILGPQPPMLRDVFGY